MDGKFPLFSYFVLVAILTGYLTCTLWMAATPECPHETACDAAKPAAGDSSKPNAQPGAPASNTNATPSSGVASYAIADCTDKSGDPPRITHLDPPAVAIGENYANVAVFGCNFKSNATPPADGAVKFNGLKRDAATAAGDHEFIVPLFATDFSAPGNIAVSVETDKTEAPPTGTTNTATTAKTTKLTSNVMNLRIKTASDIKAVWTLWLLGDEEITLELRLILLVLFTGSFAACISGLKSFVDYTGSNDLKASWYWFYYAGPFIGAGVALVFYLLIRGGFLAGTNADAKSVNPYGMVAVAALVGMFWDPAMGKLNDVFEQLFKPRDTRGDKIDPLTIDASQSPQAIAHGNQMQAFTFKATGGTPPYTWSVEPNLPAGLTLSPAGVLSGTPTDVAPAPVPINVKVTDSAGKTATRQINLTIN